LEDIYHKFEHLSKEEVIKHFVSAEFNRFLNYYKKAKDINVTDTKKDKKSVSERRSNTNFTRLFLNVGKKENLTPLRLIGIVNNALDSGNAEIGKIEILKNFSFFEIENKAAEKLASAIKSQTFEGRDLSVEIANARNGDDKSNSKDKKRKRDRKKGGKGRDRQRQRY
jgi:ATP-dependent RNA helicase DeaD